MRHANLVIGLTLLGFSLATLPPGSQAAADLDPRLRGRMPNVEPGTWCLYQESGHMIPWSRVIILTNGAVSVWRDYSYEKPLPAQPDLQEQLSPEEMRYLGMWFEVTDIMNMREGGGSSADSNFELLVFEKGKTNLAPDLWSTPQLTPLGEFFNSVRRSGANFRERMQRVLARKALGDDGSPQPIELLKFYLKAPKRADYASEALRVLGRSIPAAEWGPFLRSCLQDAGPAQRAILLQAIQNTDWNLRGRLAEDYRQQMDEALQGIDLVPLVLQLPEPTHGDMVLYMPPEGPNIEKWSDEPRPPFLVPKGVSNVAFHKKVTSSAANSGAARFPEYLARITDGEKDAEKNLVTLRKGLQWVQIDLEREYAIYAMVIWHVFSFREAFHDVIVQVSNDPEFKHGVQTLFNNDADNSAGLGKGTDKEYPEHHEGKLIDGKGIKARYARFYSNGSTGDSRNDYLEIEVYGH